MWARIHDWSVSQMISYIQYNASVLFANLLQFVIKLGKLSIWGGETLEYMECIASSAWMLVVKMQFSDVVVAEAVLRYVRCWCKWWPRSFCEILLRMTKATLKVHRKCKESFTVVQEKSNFPQAFNLFWTLDSQCPSFATVQMATAICKGQRNVKPF